MNLRFLRVKVPTSTVLDIVKVFSAFQHSSASQLSATISDDQQFWEVLGVQAVKNIILSFKVDCTRNAGATVAISPVPAMVSAGQETIAVAKGPTGLMVAVTERLEEPAAMSVLKSQLRNAFRVNKFCNSASLVSL